MPLLVVQMGHAGRTTGATGAPGEQAYTQVVGAECRRLLHGKSGWAVSTIPADPAASAYRGDAFVAVHADGSTSPRVRGASVGFQNKLGGQLAADWRSAYVARGFTGPWHLANYTANLSGYYGVRTAVAQGNTRACIIECGTITNAEDRAIMSPTRVALAIGDALGINHGWDDTEDDEVSAQEVWDHELPFVDQPDNTAGAWMHLTNANLYAGQALTAVNKLTERLEEAGVLDPQPRGEKA